MSNVPPIVERCRRPPRVVPTDARASSLKLARARTINVASFAVDASRASSHRACVGVCDTEAVGIARAPTAGDKKARENDSVSSHDSRTRFRHDWKKSPHPTRGFGKTSTIVDTPPMSTLGVDAYGSDDGASADDLFECADHALYRANAEIRGHDERLGEVRDQRAAST